MLEKQKDADIKQPYNFKCIFCGKEEVFDKAKLPKGVKFDLRCSKCGAFNLVKFEDDEK